MKQTWVIVQYGYIIQGSKQPKTPKSFFLQLQGWQKTLETFPILALVVTNLIHKMLKTEGGKKEKENQKKGIFFP